MANEFVFNKRNLEQLEPKASRYRMTDVNGRESVKGLIIEVMPSGKKVFRYRRKHLGRDIQVSIGDFPYITIEQARKQAKVLATQFSEGKDPNEVKREEAKEIAKRKALSLTIQDLFDAYVAEFKVKIRTGERREYSLEQSERVWKLYLQPKVAFREAEEFKPEEAQKLLRAILAKTSVSIHNKCLTLMKAMYGKQNSNPFWKIKKIEGKKRERILTKDEMKALLVSLSDEEQIYQDLVKMLLLTGQRKNCVFSMEWSEIDSSHRIWRIPTSKMKAKKAHAVPLTDEAMEILQRRSNEAEQGEQFVFPSKGSKHGHVVEKSGEGSFWRRVTKRAGLYSQDRDKNVTIHDLRRTVASWSVMRGGNLQVTSKLLGHSDISITASTYAHLDLENVRTELSATALEMFGQKSNVSASPDDLANQLSSLSEEEKIKLARLLLVQ